MWSIVQAREAHSAKKIKCWWTRFSTDLQRW